MAPSEQVRAIDRQSVEQQRLDQAALEHVGVLNGTVVGSISEDTVTGVNLDYTDRR